MNDEIFFKLLLTKKFDIGNGIENFGFDCKDGNYEMNFGINEGVISFEDFGVITSNGWKQLEPTDYQLETITEIVNSYIAIWDKEIQPREVYEEIDDMYDYCGVKRSDFF